MRKYLKSLPKDKFIRLILGCGVPSGLTYDEQVAWMVSWCASYRLNANDLYIRFFDILLGHKP